MSSKDQSDNLIRIPARFDMLDGTRLDVSVIAPRALMKLFDFLNREEKFIDIEDHTGERICLAKSGIKLVKGRDLPKAKELPDATGVNAAFDPYRILGLEPSARPEAVKEAYVRLVRAYQPETFAAAGLPREVMEYLASKVHQFTVAYDTLAPGE